jgi:hypothetical protein
MKMQRFQEILLYIDEKIDVYQIQYANGVKGVGGYIKDLQEIRAVLAKYHQRYM